MTGVHGTMTVSGHYDTLGIKQPRMTNHQVSFDDVILDWAVAELLSPTWLTTWRVRRATSSSAKLQNAGVQFSQRR
jgi:hypothetical protein